MNSPYLTSVFKEAKDFGRVKDFPQYKKEVQKAVKNAFKALKADLAEQEKTRGLKFSHFSLMKLLQNKLHREAPQDLNIVLKDGINGLYQCVYRSGERTFYTDLMVPPQKLNLMSINEVEKKVNEICKDTELQDYNTQDDIKVNTKVRPDRSHPVHMNESVKLCPVCKDEECVCEDNKPYLESVFDSNELDQFGDRIPPAPALDNEQPEAGLDDFGDKIPPHKVDEINLEDEDDSPSWFSEYDLDADTFHSMNFDDEPYLESIFKEKRQIFKIGQKVQVTDGSGIDSGKIGRIVKTTRLQTGWDGVPKNIRGAYRPFNTNKEEVIELEDGSLITMFRNRLKIVETKNKSVDIGSGFYVKKAGLDANGNWSIWVAKGSRGTRKIQTNGNINKAHQKKLDDIKDNDDVKTAILDYVQDYEDWSVKIESVDLSERGPDDKNLYNLVAPIVVYHLADLEYKKQAATASRKLKNPGLMEDPGPALEEYNRIWEDLIEQMGLTWEFDRWGARQIMNPQTGESFSGDEQDRFPFYLDYDMVVQRLEQLAG